MWGLNCHLGVPPKWVEIGEIGQVHTANRSKKVNQKIGQVRSAE